MIVQRNILEHCSLFENTIFSNVYVVTVIYLRTHVLKRVCCNTVLYLRTQCSQTCML